MNIAIASVGIGNVMKVGGVIHIQVSGVVSKRQEIESYLQLPPDTSTPKEKPKEESEGEESKEELKGEESKKKPKEELKGEESKEKPKEVLKKENDE